MKTSLVLDDNVFRAAKKEATRLGKTVSEIVSLWARVGRDEWMKLQRSKTKKTFRAVDLGEPQIDLSSRRNWLEELE